MELYIVSELQGEVLVVTAKGPLSLGSALSLLKQICDTAAENQVGKIFVDSLAVEGELAPFERYRLGTELAEYLIQSQIRVKLALVGKPPVLNGFGARIARNRGISANVFPSHQEALSWLDLPDTGDLASAVS